MIRRRSFLAAQIGIGLCFATNPAPLLSGNPYSPGQLLITGFRGTKISDPEVDIARRYIATNQVAGVMLLERNIRSPEQIGSLISSFLDVAPNEKPIISIDQEGGSVARVGTNNGFSSWQAPAALARSGRNNREILHYYTVRARELSEVGVNLNFGPVVDLNVNPFNPIVGLLGRSFSDDVSVVVRFAELFIRAHRAVGVKTTLKHFPGHGSSTGDSHSGTADVSGTWSAAEIAPFERLAKAGLADTLMSAHVLHRYLSDEPWIPTSLSRSSVEEIRDGLEFSGPIVADDMQMKAITDIISARDAAVRAIAVGNSLLIYSNFDNAYRIDAVQEAVLSISRALDEGRIDPIVFKRSLELVKTFRSSL